MVKKEMRQIQIDGKKKNHHLFTIVVENFSHAHVHVNDDLKQLFNFSLVFPVHLFENSVDPAAAVQ